MFLWFIKGFPKKRIGISSFNLRIQIGNIFNLVANGILKWAFTIYIGGCLELHLTYLMK